MSKKLVAYFSASGITAKVAEDLANAIDRHPGIVRWFQIFTVTDQLVDPACRLIPVQMNTGIRVPV